MFKPSAGSGDWLMPGTHWPAIPVKTVSSRFSEETLAQNIRQESD